MEADTMLIRAMLGGGVKDLTKKQQILVRLRAAVAQGEVHTAAEWARQLECSYNYIRILAEDAGLNAALRRNGYGQTKAVLKINAHGLHVVPGLFRAAGFRAGDKVLAQVKDGKIIIQAQNPSSKNDDGAD